LRIPSVTQKGIEAEISASLDAAQETLDDLRCTGIDIHGLMAR